MPRKPADNVVPFRRPKPKRWTSARDYGAPEPPRPPSRGPLWRRIGRWLSARMTGWRPWIVLVVLVTAYVLLRDGVVAF